VTAPSFVNLSHSSAEGTHAAAVLVDY